MAVVELNDVQADVAAPYPGAAGAHLFFRFERGSGRISSPSKIGVLLRALAAMVTRADSVDAGTSSTAIVGFTGSFLDGIGVHESILATLSPAFLDGMLARAATLGDEPAHWQRPFTAAPVDLAVIIRYRNEPAGLHRIEHVHQLLDAAGATCVLDQRAHGLRADLTRAEPAEAHATYEHFGFRDGISNPVLAGTPAPLTAGNGVLLTHDTVAGKLVALPRPQWRRIKPGEFLLGYEDELGELNLAPQNARLLRNATYLVWRKLEQDVEGFRRYCDELGGDGAAVRLVGRHRDGEPLAAHRGDNDFTYAAHDPTDGAIGGTIDGPTTGCPVGAHIRRMNPRAGIDLADDVVRRHRMIRRSMPYTDADRASGTRDRGLLFLCYQAAIERQFEFVQRQWLTTGELLRLGTVADAFAGPHAPLPGAAVLPAFVTCRGGEYFLVPGLMGLSELAELAGRP